MGRTGADLLVVLVLDGNVADVADGRADARAKVLLGICDLAIGRADAPRSRGRRLYASI